MSPEGVSARVLDDPAAPALETKAAAPRRIAVVGSYTIVTFRGWLIEDMVAEGHTVFACAPELSAPDLARLERAGAIYYCEKLPRTIIEAIAIGRLVTAANFPGCRDAVEHGVTGWLNPAARRSGARGASIGRYERRNETTAMGAASRLAAERDYDLQTAAVPGKKTMGLNRLGGVP